MSHIQCTCVLYMHTLSCKGTYMYRSPAPNTRSSDKLYQVDISGRARSVPTGGENETRHLFGGTVFLPKHTHCSPMCTLNTFYSGTRLPGIVLCGLSNTPQGEISAWAIQTDAPTIIRNSCQQDRPRHA